MKKSTSSKVNNGSALRAVLLILLVLELCAAVLLSTRLMHSGGGKTNRISLTEGGEGTRVTVIERKSAPIRAYRPQLHMAPVRARLLSAASADSDADTEDFTASDKDKIWQTETEVEIFHVRYDDNGDLVYTVESGANDKVLAPGTGSAYSFTLDNTGKMPLDYTLTFACWMEGEGEEFIPVESRLYRSTGEYLLGDPSQWTPVEQVGDVIDEKALRSGESMEYVFEWQWPFERSDDEHDIAYYDAEDTALGNAAVERDISLHIRIMTVAEIDEELIDVNEPDLPLAGPGGRAWALVNLICTILSVLIGIYELIIYLRGRKENKAAKEDGIYEGDIYTKRVMHRKRKIWDVLPAVGAVVAFILTEDMRLPMTIVDRWTPLMVIILAISVTIGLLTHIQRYKKMLEKALEERDEAVSVG